MRITLPRGNAPRPLSLPHFPDRLHAVVWRNWELIATSRLARVLRSSIDEVTKVAVSMGLPREPHIPNHAPHRNYITIIRSNWHLLPYEQLAELLGWDIERLAYTLREDDFLFIKLGEAKPECTPVYYRKPAIEIQKRAAEIRSIVAQEFGDSLDNYGEIPFTFLEELSRPAGTHTADIQTKRTKMMLRIIYSYCGLYGDPLLEREPDPFPEALLERYARLGINGVWIQAVLHTLAYWSLAPKLSNKYQQRLENLQRFIDKAKRYGIGIYLYLNEPRAMKEAFFAKHPHLKGVTDKTDGSYAALCTSHPQVRVFLEDSLSAVFTAVPDIAGVFTITMSENLTNCHSRNQGHECQRCSARKPAEVIAEVNNAIYRGVRKVSNTAQVIAYDWGWRDEWAEEVIELLPEDMWLMSVSEWSLPIERGAIASTVGEYSISSVGPGPRALKHWSAAQKRGLRTMAKIQANNTWELSAVPYIPAMHLIAEHARNLSDHAIDGLLLSWTLGGYPSPNLEVVSQYYGAKPPSVEKAIEIVAARRYGGLSADVSADLSQKVIQAWGKFSLAFREFPFHIQVVYMAPLQVGPANLLHRSSSGYKASMAGLAYDDLKSWRAIYPSDVFQQQFEKVADIWRDGLDILEEAVSQTSKASAGFDSNGLRSCALEKELNNARAAYLHIRSVAQQVEYVRIREIDWQRCLDIVQKELDTARAMFDVVNQDSRIGYEASNHYFYNRLDFVEKVLNCRFLIDSNTQFQP